VRLAPSLFLTLLVPAVGSGSCAAPAAQTQNSGQSPTSNSAVSRRLIWPGQRVAIAGSTIFLETDSRTVVARNLDSGEELWRREDVGRDPAFLSAVANSLAASGGEGTQVTATGYRDYYAVGLRNGETRSLEVESRAEASRYLGRGGGYLAPMVPPPSATASSRNAP